jgi:CRISPR-associated endonuclease/helicase Cas3
MAFIPSPDSFYAHTTSDGRAWEPLFTAFGENVDTECQGRGGADCSMCRNVVDEHGHLNKVAFWCGEFAANMYPTGPFRETARAWGWQIGLWHDLGKYSMEFQSYLRAVTGDDAHVEERSAGPSKVDHSTAGAIFAYGELPFIGTILAYLIAGHHAGLPDGVSAQAPASTLKNRLKRLVPEWMQHAPSELLNLPLQVLKLPGGAYGSPYGAAMWQRLLFSCLVDADFLCTEAFMAADSHARRRRQLPSLEEMEACVRRRLDAFGAPEGKVGRARASVVDACLAAAERKPGLFSLTVPTGGGKTLSSLAFAIKHARIHGLDRVIYAIPFTSIIEQNASVFRVVFESLGEDVVLEHHSNLDPDASHVTRTSRLAAENWDARLIVTTNVQLFESVHAARTSRCRKLHRIARSVIILDEAQSLPVELLQSCLRALGELVNHYGCTVVLCTATQPVLHYRDDFKIGLEQPTEIIPAPEDLYGKLVRVAVKNIGPCSDLDIATRLGSEAQALCIVNTKRHAATLYRMLGKDDAHFHLSTRLCPAHRSARLTEIKARLAIGHRCRVISTQLIEAGVDIDFPSVYRALAGLDSIAQAAGRCNREGKLAEPGRVFLFTPEHPIPKGFLRQAADAAAEIVPRYDDPLSLDAVRHFFELLLSENIHRSGFTDVKRIMDCFVTDPTLLGYQFRTCAERFQFIEAMGEPIIVPWGSKGRRLCEELERSFDPTVQQVLSRKLQRFIVLAHERIRTAAIAKGAVRMVHDRFPILIDDTAYDQELGLVIEDDANPAVESLIL